MMTLKNLHDNFLQLDDDQIISLINENRNELKLLFINAEVNDTNSSQLGQILVYIAQLQIREEARMSEEIQFLYTELAFYFKRSNNHGFVANCISNITESVLKNRLKAWLHHKLYTDINSHVTLFKNYLDKLSTAITDGIEDYENDVLRDLHNYFIDTIDLMKRVGKQDLIDQFSTQFDDEQLQNEYPLLTFYNANKFQFTTGTSIKEATDKIFEPSLFTERLFEEKFLQYIKKHPDTNWHHILLGYDNYTIRSQIINYGQANFDNTYGKLTASDVAKLYSYFNMRKHYYSSLYLFERFNLFETLYSTSGVIKFIDIGCGPATSAIAITDFLHSITNSKVSFDYFGIDYYASMRNEAEYFMDNWVYEKTAINTYLKNISDFNFDWLKNANSIFINTCYLFASSSLDEKELAKSILNVKKAKPDVPFFILFQNTTDDVKNQKYFSFKSHLPSVSIILSERSSIKYNNRRNSYFQPTEETVYFEILQLI